MNFLASFKKSRMVQTAYFSPKKKSDDFNSTSQKWLYWKGLYWKGAYQPFFSCILLIFSAKRLKKKNRVTFQVIFMQKDCKKNRVIFQCKKIAEKVGSFYRIFQGVKKKIKKPVKTVAHCFFYALKYSRKTQKSRFFFFFLAYFKA